MIRFFSEDIEFKVPKPILTKRWLTYVAEEEGTPVNALNYIFCSDQYLFRLNVDFLAHDTLTDVITFDYSEDSGLEAEVYISVERVRSNSLELHVMFEEELRRVMVHGLLHLVGYSDKDPVLKLHMTEKEDYFLNQYRCRFT